MMSSDASLSVVALGHGPARDASPDCELRRIADDWAVHNLSDVAPIEWKSSPGVVINAVHRDNQDSSNRASYYKRSAAFVRNLGQQEGHRAHVITPTPDIGADSSAGDQFAVAPTIWEVMPMLEPNSDITVESHGLASPIANDGASRRTAALLDELLVDSIKLRDLYKSARWQTADIQFRGLRILFDAHYKEQLHLVDVLLDRIRVLGGAGRVLAGLLLQGAQFSYALRGRVLPIRLLRDLLNAHDTVLAAARLGSDSDERADTASIHDFAVGQVVLVNNMQFQAISDQLIAQSDRRRATVARQDGRDAHG
jgi:starvation-inducible DNA-binding protein